MFVSNLLIEFRKRFWWYQLDNTIIKGKIEVCWPKGKESRKRSSFIVDLMSAGEREILRNALKMII